MVGVDCALVRIGKLQNCFGNPAKKFETPKKRCYNVGIKQPGGRYYADFIEFGPR